MLKNIRRKQSQTIDFAFSFEATETICLSFVTIITSIRNKLAHFEDENKTYFNKRTRYLIIHQDLDWNDQRQSA
jgi:hypothetical protein